MNSSLSLSTYVLLGIRNLSRNPRRTALTLIALVISVGALTFLLAFINAYMNSMKENFVLSMNGHIQVYGENFKDTGLIDDYIKNSLIIEKFLQNSIYADKWTQRITTSGLASVARSTTSVAIIGVDPIREIEVSRLGTFIIDGQWLEGGNRGVILGSSVADNLEVEINDKIVFMTQGPGGSFVSEAFRLRGILHSGIPDIDKTVALIAINPMQSWLGIEDGATEIVIIASSFEDVDFLVDDFKNEFGSSIDARAWYQENPLINQMLGMQTAASSIMISVVVALVLGQLINTMFMSLYDRIREFGVMEALGSQRLNLFAMLITESMLVVFIGGLIGYGIAYVAVLYTAEVGIDLSLFGDTLGSLYVDSVLRPSIDLNSTILVFIAILITSILAGLFPAWRATKLNPIDSMRQV